MSTMAFITAGIAILLLLVLREVKKLRISVEKEARPFLNAHPEATDESQLKEILDHIVTLLEKGENEKERREPANQRVLWHYSTVTPHWNKDRVRFDYWVNGEFDESLTTLGEGRQANATDLVLDVIGGRGGELVTVLLLDNPTQPGAKEWTFLFKHPLTADEWSELKFKSWEERKRQEARAQGTKFNVVLTDIGSEKANVMKLVHEVTGLALKEVKFLVDNVPKPIKEGVSIDEAEALKQKFTRTGAIVEIE